MRDVCCFVVFFFFFFRSFFLVPLVHSLADQSINQSVNQSINQSKQTKTIKKKQKKNSYVLAFAPSFVLDVTPRYAARWKAVSVALRVRDTAWFQHTLDSLSPQPPPAAEVRLG